MRNAIVGLAVIDAIAFLARASGANDRAVVPAADVHRLVWEHAEGLCQFIDKGETHWVEVDKKTGTVSFRFKETCRNGDFVELLDHDRGLTVRLFKNALFLKGVAFEDFTKYYDGRWVK